MAVLNWKNNLEESKNSKIEELSRSCNLTILGRFTSPVDGVQYQFSNDLEAQANFEKCDKAFDRGMITEILWTAYDISGNATRVLLNSESFEVVYYNHLEHIQNNISRFRDLLIPQVKNATTIEEVEDIKW
jgi:hypothetical protein